MSLDVNNLFISEGSDSLGVVTKMLTSNGSLWLGVHTLAMFVGIHVTSTLVNLIYSKIVIAIGRIMFAQQNANNLYCNLRKKILKLNHSYILEEHAKTVEDSHNNATPRARYINQ